MLYKRNRLYKRKIIGVSIFANLQLCKETGNHCHEDSIRERQPASKNALKTSNVKTLLANKVKDAAKKQFGVSNLAEANKLALETAKAATVQKVNQLGENLAQKKPSRRRQRG